MAGRLLCQSRMEQQRRIIIPLFLVKTAKIPKRAGSYKEVLFLPVGTGVLDFPSEAGVPDCPQRYKCKWAKPNPIYVNPKAHISLWGTPTQAERGNKSVDSRKVSSFSVGEVFAFGLGGIFFFFEAEEQPQKGFAVKGDEGVEITVLAVEGGVENKAQGNKKQSQGKAPYPKEGYQDQQ